MMPMVFCASLVPWPRLYSAAENELAAAEDVVDAGGRALAEEPEDDDHEERAERPAQERGDRR